MMYRWRITKRIVISTSVKPDIEVKMVSRRRRKVNQLFANDLSFLNPQLLSREAILRLLPRLVVSRLVVRDFSPTPALFGDVIQIPRPGQFVMTRKDGICDSIVVQDVTGDRVQARLDQW